MGTTFKRFTSAEPNCEEQHDLKSHRKCPLLEMENSKDVNPDETDIQRIPGI